MRWPALGVLLALALAGCEGGPRYYASSVAPVPCEPGGPVSATVRGTVGAGVSNEGSVTGSDIDLVIGVRPSATACR